MLAWGLGGIFCVLGIVKLIIAIYIWLGLVDAAATGVVGTAAETPVWVGMFLGILAWICGVIYLIQRVQRQ